MYNKKKRLHMKIEPKPTDPSEFKKIAEKNSTIEFFQPVSEDMPVKAVEGQLDDLTKARLAAHSLLYRNINRGDRGEHS
jgi:hypothetical protein